MVRNKIEIYCAQLAKNASKLSTMVGEKNEIYCYQMAKNVSNWLEKIIFLILKKYVNRCQEKRSGLCEICKKRGEKRSKIEKDVRTLKSHDQLHLRTEHYAISNIT